MVQILELFGGIGSPRIALRNLGIDVKAIDYVEIDEKAVRSYNAIFHKEIKYKTQNVVGYNLKPDILIHGSPCQDFSIAGYQKGADEGSETRSSLMWETIHIIQQMGVWKPRIVIWENVKNVLSKHSQKVTVKTGVASVSDAVVPNPVTLAPYRTFPEVEQPESKFIFRMKEGPTAALFEADGGAWRNTAILGIKEYLKEALKDNENIEIIA